MTTVLTHKVSVGCDPEVFIKDSKGDFVSAHGIIKGDKKNPHRVPFGAVQVDGMACEFNTDPAWTEKDFVNNVSRVFETLEGMLPTGLNLSKGVPVAKFSPKVFNAQPEEALELGCEPDFNAYTGKANPRPEATNKFMRTAAGHIHLGYKNTNDPTGAVHMSSCCGITKMLDVFLGLDSLEYDKDSERRELYGKAGAFRPKTYGVEYRVLSNAWLTSESLIKRVYNITRLTAEIYLEGGVLPEDMYHQAAEMINTNDEKGAADLLIQAKSFFGV